MPNLDMTQRQTIQNDLPKYEDLNHEQIIFNRITNLFRSTNIVLPSVVCAEIYGCDPPKYGELDKNKVSV